MHLQPGGLHLMFIDLKQQIRPGEQVPVSLTVRDAEGKAHRLKVMVPALRNGPGHH